MSAISANINGPKIEENRELMVKKPKNSALFCAGTMLANSDLLSD